MCVLAPVMRACYSVMPLNSEARRNEVNESEVFNVYNLDLWVAQDEFCFQCVLLLWLFVDRLKICSQVEHRAIIY